MAIVDGPVRLSLLDSIKRKIINTIEIHGMYEGAQDPDHGFPIPFLVRNGSYLFPKPKTSQTSAAKRKTYRKS